ncbi:unnamed protein product [Urochloa decumbens]|uniref:Nodulation signaling pathway 1-like protein n=1 Tax=Urochloa decumbens TaxID=240449 RepID=A0ABC9H4D2_9POAL
MKPMGCHEQERPAELAAATSSTGAFDWLDDSISSFLAADVDLAAAAGFGWWPSPAATAHPQPQDDIGSVVAQALSPPAPSPLPHASPSIASPAASSPSAEPAPSTKKRKSPAHRQASGAGGAHGSSSSYQRRRADHDRPGGGGKKAGGSKGSGGAGSDRDARWAEQLLNPCAAALEAGNLSRAQHLLYVIGELASFSGDANHRLAAHGLRALARRLPASVRVPPPPCSERPPPAAFAGAEPRLFRAALIRFHEVSPWFALPNALANAAIAQHAAAPGRRPLHVVDLGVSHGVQWPTLLESLTRLPGGRAPPSVRLTVVAAAAATPFSAAPPGYDFSPHLLRYAKSINLPLAITRASSLDTVVASPSGCGAGEDEALVVCLQFRLGHAGGDERAGILSKVRGLNPELVVLSELDAGGGGGTAAGEFAARLEMLWRFLESTAAAFKGRDGEERRLLEAEAGTSVCTADAAAAGEGREAWRERMAAAGFEEAAFGDEAVESARSLLRKYDGGWEMAPPPPQPGAAAGKAVTLRWKGQPVSFCSLWRPACSG